MIELILDLITRFGKEWAKGRVALWPRSSPVTNNSRTLPVPPETIGSSSKHWHLKSLSSVEHTEIVNEKDSAGPKTHLDLLCLVVDKPSEVLIGLVKVHSLF